MLCFDCWGFRVKPGMTVKHKALYSIIEVFITTYVIPGLTRNTQLNCIKPHIKVSKKMLSRQFCHLYKV
jgi:hypothetical protein